MVGFVCWTAKKEDPYGKAGASDYQVTIKFKLDSSESTPKLHQNESYFLRLINWGEYDGRIVVSISASTYFGARHAVESLSQLLAYDSVSGKMHLVDNVWIKDSPAYPHRGLILDTSRNFFPMAILRRVVDGLSYNKMNVFHWYITDTHREVSNKKGQRQI